MLSIKRIKFRIVRGAIFRDRTTSTSRCPPRRERIRALFPIAFPRGAPAGLVFSRPGAAHMLRARRTASSRPHVFVVADPHVEIRVDPRCRENSRRWREFRRPRRSLRGGERANIRIVLNVSIELAEKFAAVAGIIFPGVFAVQNQADGGGRGPWIRSPVAQCGR